jgi:hypothetical protein
LSINGIYTHTTKIKDDKEKKKKKKRNKKRKEKEKEKSSSWLINPPSWSWTSAVFPNE